MDQIFDSGIQIILFLQGLGNWLLPPMKAITSTGSETFYLVILPAIYWCINHTFGLQLSILIMLSGAINDALKVFLHTPRPFWYDTAVKAHAHEYQFGNPSGHSQNAVVFWAYSAYQIKKIWAWIFAVILILLIGISRMVLGMHFHLDVIVGWLIGIGLLWTFNQLAPKISAWLAGKNIRFKVAAIFITAMALLGLYSLSIATLGDWTIPPEWQINAAAALEELPESPLTYRGNISKIAVIFGLGIGAITIQQFGGFEVRGTIGQKSLRYLIGISITAAIWVGLDLIFPDGDQLIALVFRFIRYALTGFWVAGGAPLLFKRLKLL